MKLATKLGQRVDELTAAILDIDAHATPYGYDADDFVSGGYIVSVGAMHRALGLVGHTAPKVQEHAVWIDTQHGPGCEGCEQMKVVALDALAAERRP